MDLSVFIHGQYLIVSLLMASTGVLAVLQVALITYGHRCRHPALRFLQWGASVVFIPLTAYIISHYMSKVKAQSVVCPHVYPQYYSFQNHESQQVFPTVNSVIVARFLNSIVLPSCR